MPLADNDIKSELSYAYLHAVAARAGCECQHAGRHSDNLGIDARITAQGDFAPAPSLTLFDVYVQLKATSQNLTVVRNRLSFRIEKSQYDKMRVTTVNNQWLLVVLLLPSAAADWVKASPQALTVKTCAYWVSLREAPAPPTGPDDKMTIHIPKRNRFTVDALRALLVRCSQEDWVTYED
jgi:hypothetical protein